VFADIFKKSVSMHELGQLFANNQAWAKEKAVHEPGFFRRLARNQEPRFLWIGCSDSRVPAEEIVGLSPGDMLVHRNIANLVLDSDLNCQSVIQFAVHMVGVEHVIVCGHYSCAGVLAALRGDTLGLIDSWICNVREIRAKHHAQLTRLADENQRFDRLCELNVIEQVSNVCHATPIRQAWGRGRQLAVHGWIYDVADGLLHDLAMSVNSASELAERYEAACG
jgi:carbonic anhydrase